MITADQLLAIMPHAGPRAEVFVGHLDLAMQRFGIHRPLCQAAFLAEVAHESGSLRYMREIASGEAYEGRADLGNTEPGDGMRFPGRGILGVTGRHNYRRCSLALFGDESLLVTPWVLEQVAPACHSGGWFWQDNHLNTWADVGDFDGVSDVINRGRKTARYGDANGFKQRLAFYELAKEVLCV